MTDVTDPSTLQELDGFVQAFEREYFRGRIPDIVAYLPPREHPLYAPLLRELVRVDIELAADHGIPRPLSDYLNRFPELVTDSQALAALERELRRQEPSGNAHDPGYYLTPTPNPNAPTARFESPPIVPHNPDSFAEVARSYYRSFHSPLKGIATNGDGHPEAPGEDPHQAIDQWCASVAKNPAEARFFREVHRNDPERAERLARGIAELPSLGKEFLGFRLISELGHGAFGRVFLALQGELADRPVALKITTESYDESGTLAQLQHTNIVPIYSIHRAPPFQAVCMPFFGATTLKDIGQEISRVKTIPTNGRLLFSKTSAASTREAIAGAASSKNGFSTDSAANGVKPTNPAPGDPNHLPSWYRVDLPTTSGIAEMRKRLEDLPYEQAVLWLFARLADGLEHAHQRGILHRDIKPANILLSDDGQPMLLDFNLAQDIKLGSDAAATIGGTLPYMSPEQLETMLGLNIQIDERSDIYSLGIILYEMLSGTYPFECMGGRDASILATMIAERRGGPPEIRDANPGLSRAAASIVRHCLEPLPSRRYQSARQLHEDIELQLANRPLRYAPETSIRERVQKWSKRNPKLTSITSILLITAILITALVFAALGRVNRMMDYKARLTFASFEKDVRSATLMLTTTDPKGRDEAFERCRKALETYHVLDAPNWRDDKRFTRLPDADRTTLQERVGEVLELMAHALTLNAESGKGQDRLSEALRLNTLAEACYTASPIPRALWSQRAKLFRQLGQADKAKQAEATAAQTPVKSSRDQILLAYQDISEGQYARAKRVLHETTQESPRNFWAWYLLGICNDRLENYEASIPCYSVCVSLEPEFEEPWYDRGLARARRGDLEMAREDFTRAIEIRPDWPQPYLNRALVLRSLGQYAKAIEDLDHALKLGAPKAYTHFARSLVRFDAGDKVGARQDREEGLRHKPDDEAGWTARAIAAMRADPKTALDDFQKVLEINPRSLTALQNRAALLAGLPGREEDAIAAFQRAIELYPDIAALHSGLGRTLASIGRREPAIAAGERALALSRDPKIIYQVGCIYALCSDTVPDDRSQAFRLISQAIRSGFGFDELSGDEDLDALRKDPRFQKLIEAARALEKPPH